MEVGGYELEIKRVKKLIKDEKPGKIAMQVPDGMKQHATTIADRLKEETGIKPDIWMGSNFGACDIPDQLNSRYDLLIHFGHSPWIFSKGIKPKYSVVNE